MTGIVVKASEKPETEHTDLAVRRGVEFHRPTPLRRLSQAGPQPKRIVTLRRQGNRSRSNHKAVSSRMVASTDTGCFEMFASATPTTTLRVLSNQRT